MNEAWTTPPGLKGLLLRSVEWFKVRLELLSVELQQALGLALGLLFAVLLTVALVVMVVVLLVLATVVAFWDQHPVAVLMGLAGLLSVGVWGLVVWVRRRLASLGQLFQASLAELQADRSALVGQTPQSAQPPADGGSAHSAQSAATQ